MSDKIWICLKTWECFGVKLLSIIQLMEQVVWSNYDFEPFTNGLHWPEHWVLSTNSIKIIADALEMIADYCIHG